MGLDLRSPDHTTLSRRGQHLNLTLRRVPRRAALHLFIDSTGLSMVGEGEWAAAKHGRRGRRGWKKLHLGVDQAGVIVAQALTDSAVDDASTGIDLIATIASSARTVTADAAYDTLAFYETANTRGHDRRRAAGEDSQAVPTQPAVERSRWDDQKDQQDWTPSVEEGGRLSSTGPRRERVLPVQVDSRRSTSKSDSRSASCRIGACVQRAQSNDRAWSTRVVRDRSVTNLRVGALGASFDLRNNAANKSLELDIEDILFRPPGRPSCKPLVRYKSFRYQAKSWTTPRRIVAKVEHHRGELFPRVGFIVTNMALPSRSVVRFYNKRGTAEQWIKEGKQATHWTRLSCHRFRANEVRLQLSVLAYNLGNLWRRLILPPGIKRWSLTSLQQRLVKTGGRLVKHARYYWLLLAEGHLNRRLFGEMLRRIWALPVPAG